MSIDLNGQVAVITGGNGGIGLGMAEGVAKAGADVAIWARNADKSAEAVERITALGVRAVAVTCDVADEASTADAVAETVSRLGRIDIAVANAGTSGLGTLQDMSFEEWRRVLSINLDGVFLTFRDCARRMIEQGEGGAMVAISSTSSVHGAPHNPHYASSKTAVLGLVRSAAVGLARENIRVNALSPGWTKTDLASPVFEHDKMREVTTGRTPVRRWAEHDEYHDVAAYLCDKSITFHTGDTVTFDGGYTIF